jgi:hypothetical protein
MALSVVVSTDERVVEAVEYILCGFGLQAYGVTSSRVLINCK